MPRAMSDPTEAKFQCCFCGRSIEGDLRSLELELDDGGEQVLYCHEECLRRVVHPSVPLAI